MYQEDLTLSSLCCTLLVRLNEKLFLDSLGGHWALVRLTPSWPKLRGRGSPTRLTVWGTQLREMIVCII